MKFFSFITTDASASATAPATEQLEVGTIPSGSASVFTVAFITTSTFSDNNDGVFPKIPIIFDFLVLNIGSRKISSGVFPLFDKKITGSPNSCIPKSPCTASDG